jgi:threonylcarbamoyladenosine tRNA methylthiotransferase MtaB
MILKRMKRRHARKDTIAFCDEVRRLRPDAAFGADLIAGFPTETEAMFANTLALIDDAGLSTLHVFPFSARKGTPAARMPQLDRKLVKDRAKRLRGKGEEALARRLQNLVGSEQILLVEKPGFGRTGCFAPADLPGSAASGGLVRARIAGVHAGQLRAEMLA